MYSFSELFFLFTGMLFLVVLFSFINEKTFKLPYEIGLVIFGFVFCLSLIVLLKGNVFTVPLQLFDLGKQFNFNDFLINGVLCFMLFSGASKIKFNDFNEDKYLIGRMAILGTVFSIIVYGLLFWGLGYLSRMPISFLQALILGSIIAPSDPISAMSILSKVGLPKRLSLIIEGESLFNDGVAVAVFATLMSIFKNSTKDIYFGRFVWNLGMDILGAVGVGLLISFLLFQIFKHSKNKYLKVFSSILTVMLAYLLCEDLGFSGPIAAVLCGLYYATGIAGLERKNGNQKFEDIHDLFYSFWDVTDNLLNGILFLLIGLLFVDVVNFNEFSFIGIGVIAFGSIIINTISRVVGVFINALITENLPLNMLKSRFTIFFTWAGLKGGLCLALVMGTSSAFSPEIYNVFLISTYAIVLFTTIFQGLTVGKVYQKLK